MRLKSVFSVPHGRQITFDTIFFLHDKVILLYSSFLSHQTISSSFASAGARTQKRKSLVSTVQGHSPRSCVSQAWGNVRVSVGLGDPWQR